MTKLFRTLSAYERHNENTTWTLYDPYSDQYITATYSRYHGAYDATVTELDYDNDEKEITTTALLTDADLNNAEIR